MKKVACVGILVADVIVEPVNKYPEKGLLERVNSITVHSGGNAMTAAVNLRKLGTESTLVGKVGRDMFGDFLIKRLNEEGVKTDGIFVDNDVQTSASVLMLDGITGERTILHCTGSNAALTVDDIDFSVIEENDIVFVTGTFLMDRFDGTETAEFLRRCKEMGKITALDVCWDAKGSWSKLLDPAMPYIDYFLPSIDEAKMLANREEVSEMADVFFDKGVGHVVIKCGSRGCYCRYERDGEGTMIPAFRIENPVDTTGAGDSFCSGFLAALSRGEDFLDCAEMGNATGAFCVTQKGATSGTPTYEEAKKFIKERK